MPTKVIDPGPVGPPLPEPDPSTRFFWEGARRHELLIMHCNNCGRYHHWPRPICRFCLSSDIAPKAVSGRGTLYSYTVAVQPFHPWFADKTPYVIATVELVEQERLRLLSNLVDCDEADIEVDMPVRVVFREVTPEITLPLFRPAGSLAGA
jgi:uncharacterized protein